MRTTTPWLFILVPAHASIHSINDVVTSRFNLLLLDHNDQYFEDYAVVYYDNDAAEK
jgi:hypothetical protein